MFGQAGFLMGVARVGCAVIVGRRMGDVTVLAVEHGLVVVIVGGQPRVDALAGAAALIQVGGVAGSIPFYRCLAGIHVASFAADAGVDVLFDAPVESPSPAAFARFGAKILVGIGVGDVNVVLDSFHGIKPVARRRFGGGVAEGAVGVAGGALQAVHVEPDGAVGLHVHSLRIIEDGVFPVRDRLAGDGAGAGDIRDRVEVGELPEPGADRSR